MKKCSILLKIFIIVLLVSTINIFFINNVSALTLDSATAYPYRSYACQPITLYANFTGVPPDVVYANINIEQAIFEHNVVISQAHNITMTTSGGGIWSATWGNDQTIHWGQRSITYNTYTVGILNTFSVSNVVFIMNSGCIGTGKTNYTQTAPSGLGKFETLMWQNPELNILDLGLYYWLQTWGFLFYVLVMGTITLSVIMKTQNIMSGVIAVLVMLLFAAPFGIVPVEYRSFYGIVISLAIGSVYVKFFLKSQ